jgi:hypothetical protein
MLRQQSIHDFRPVTEARRLQSGESVREVNHPTPRAQVQHAQSARRRQAQLPGDGDTGAIIHQDQGGAKRARQGESFAFANVECAPRRIINGLGNGPHLKPSRRLCGPGAHDRRRVLV